MVVPVCICMSTNMRQVKGNFLAAIKSNGRNKHGVMREAREQSSKTEKRKEVNRE